MQSTALLEFLKELKGAGGHCLQVVKTVSGKDMVYYRNCGDYVTSTKVKVF